MSAMPLSIHDANSDDPNSDVGLFDWVPVLLPPGRIVEVRGVGIPNKTDPKKPFTLVSFHKTEDANGVVSHLKFAESSGARGVYFTLNPVDPNQRKLSSRSATKDEAIASRWLLLIDCDPVKALADSSASNTEKAASYIVAFAIRDYLREMGWPEPAVCDSGNGFHLVYRIDLPNDASSRLLVKAVLETLAVRFNNESVHVDVLNFNASRVTKGYGTLARKGDPSDERPHRRSSVISLPPELVTVDREKLEALASSWLHSEEQKKRPRPAPDSAPFNPNVSLQGGKLQDQIRRYGLAAFRDELAKVASAAPGERNDTLNKAAFAIGQLVGARAVYEQEAVEGLVSAGLFVGPDEAKIRDTTMRGLRDGMAQPRDLSHVGQDHRNGHVDAKVGKHVQAPTDIPSDSASDQAERPYTDEDVVPDSSALPLFANFYEKLTPTPDGKQAMVKVPEHALDIDSARQRIVGPWPKRVGDTLFFKGVDDRGDPEPIYISSSQRLMAHMGARSHVAWAKGMKMVPQERYYEHLRMTVERFDTIERIPHFPSIAGAYYMHRSLPAPGGAFERLVAMFSPASEADRSLIRAMIMTLFWGGQSGSRPAFLITVKDDDKEQGRGVGKSTLGKVVAEGLVGGYLSISADEPFDVIKTRFLSPDARLKRVAILDNLKTHRFSWGEMEGLITEDQISGRMLYVGDGTRPNTLTYLITLNGASLSKDMAQRVAIIELTRPVHDPEWEPRLRAFIKEHRWEIIADIGAILDAPGKPLVTRTRWAAWEKNVLAKVPLAVDAQALMVERQGTVDDDNEERDIVADRFRDEIHRCTFLNADESRVFIRSETIMRWVNKALNKNFATNQASGHLKMMGIPELEKSLSKKIRGWYWTGKGWDTTSKTIKVVDPLDTVCSRPEVADHNHIAPVSPADFDNSWC